MATEEGNSNDGGYSDGDDVHNYQCPYGRPPVRRTVALGWLIYLDRWKCLPSLILLNAHRKSSFAVMSLSRSPSVLCELGAGQGDISVIYFTSARVNPHLCVSIWWRRRRFSARVSPSSRSNSATLQVSPEVSLPCRRDA